MLLHTEGRRTHPTQETKSRITAHRFSKVKSNIGTKNKCKSEEIRSFRSGNQQRKNINFRRRSIM